MKKIGNTYVLPKIEDAVLEKELEEVFGVSIAQRESAGPLKMLSVRCNDQWAENGWIEEPTRLDDLELPRTLPKNLDLSQAVLLIGESKLFTRVFIFNSGSLYHVCDKEASQHDFLSQKGGYAGIDGKIYFFSNFYVPPALSFTSSCLPYTSEELSLIEEAITRVDRFDLKTKCWDPQFSKLNQITPSPLAFVFDEKIYVIRGLESLAEHILIQCLNPRDSTCTNLPNPPPSLFLVPYVLDTPKGILLFATYDEEREEVDPDVPFNALYEFHLTDHHWKYHSPLPKFYIDAWESRPRAPFFHPPPPSYNIDFQDLFAGCRVGNHLFCYDSELTPGVPLIVVYDVSSKGDDHVVKCKIDLSEHLQSYVVDLCPSTGYLNHLEGNKFCLVIVCWLQAMPASQIACILTFELHPTDATQSEATAHQPKQRKAENSSFTLQGLQCRRFQLPVDVTFFFCKKM